MADTKVPPPSEEETASFTAISKKANQPLLLTIIFMTRKLILPK